MSNIAGSLISAGAGLLGSMLNGISQNDANSQMAHQWHQSYLENRRQYEQSKLPYQVMLARQAGVSPALALSQGSVGSFAATGSPAPSSQGAVDYSGMLGAALANPFGSQERLNNSVGRYNDANTQKVAEEAIGENIDNQYRNEMWKSRIYNTNMDSWQKEKLVDSINYENEFLRRTMRDRVQQQSIQTKLAKANADAASLHAMYLPMYQTAELDNMLANTSLAVKQGIATIKQAHAAIMSASAAMQQAQNQRDVNGALYGSSPEERAEYSKAVYNYLLQQTTESESREFSNQFQNHQQSGSMSGMTFSGSYSYNTPVWHQSDYKNFKATKGHTHRR